MGERCYEMPRTQSPLIIGRFAGGAEDFRIKDSDTTSSFESDQSLFLLIGRWGACWMQSGAGCFTLTSILSLRERRYLVQTHRRHR